MKKLFIFGLFLVLMSSSVLAGIYTIDGIAVDTDTLDSADIYVKINADGSRTLELKFIETSGLPEAKPVPAKMAAYEVIDDMNIPERVRKLIEQTISVTSGGSGILTWDIPASHPLIIIEYQMGANPPAFLKLEPTTIVAPIPTSEPTITPAIPADMTTTIRPIPGVDPTILSTLTEIKTQDGKTISFFGEGGSQALPIGTLLLTVPTNANGQGTLIISEGIPIDKNPIEGNAIISSDTAIIKVINIEISTYNIFGLFGLLKLTMEKSGQSNIWTGEILEAVCEIESFVTTEDKCKTTAGSACAYSFSPISGFEGEKTGISTIGQCTTFPNLGVEWSVTMNGCKIDSFVSTEDECQAKIEPACAGSFFAIPGFDKQKIGMCNYYPAGKSNEGAGGDIKRAILRYYHDETGAYYVIDYI